MNESGMSSTTAVLLRSAANHKCTVTTVGIIELLIEVAVAIPTFLLYGLIFRNYFNQRRRCMLNVHFFRLFMLNSAVNIVGYVIYFPFLRLPGLGLLCEPLLFFFTAPSRFLSPIFFLAYFTVLAGAVSTVSISLNRACAVIYYNKTNEIASRLTPICVSLTWLLPLLAFWPLLFSPAYYLPVYNGLGINYVRTVPYPRNSLTCLVTSLLCALIVVIATSASVARLNALALRHRRSEAALVIVGSVLSATQLLFTAHQVSMYVSFNEFLYQKLFIFTDLSCFAPPWSLLALSASVRQEILRQLFRARRRCSQELSLPPRIVTAASCDESEERLATATPLADDRDAKRQATPLVFDS